MRRRRDTFVRPNSVADVQELSLIASNQKDRLEAKEEVYKKKIDEIYKEILIVREEFLSFLKNNDIDPNYPVTHLVTTDAVVPTTVPEQSLEAVPIEEAMLPNIPNDTFLLTMQTLQNKYETLQDEIEDYSDKLLKMRLHKAQLEAKLEGLLKSTKEYRDKVKERESDYKDAVLNLNKLRSFYQTLLDFKYLFSVLPDTFTSESYMRFQNNNLNRYSLEYYQKKTRIKKMSDSLQETYKMTVFDTMEEGFYTTVFRNVSIYFSSQEDETLPDKYIDAMPKKDTIIKKLDEFSESINNLIQNSKITIDAIRGVKGIGNSIVDGLITSTNEIAQSFAAKNKVEATTLNSVSGENYTLGVSVNQNIKNIKSRLQAGVENLDEKFIKASGGFLRKIALTLGFPVNFAYVRETNVEDYVREMVRQKYGGNLPFCDEEEITDSKGNKVFVKKTDIDEKTGKTKTDSQGYALEKKTDTNRDLLSC